MKYKAIIFDLDGVIISTDDYHYVAWKQIAKQLHVPFNRTINERLRGISRMQSLEIILENTTSIYSLEQKKDILHKKNKLYRHSLSSLTPKDVDIVVIDTVERLKNKGLLLAIGSSSENATYIIERIGLTKYFDAICDGKMITHSKPHPEVFMSAADTLKVAYKDCLVVEDANAGCIAAKSATMKVAAISSAYNNPFADYHLNSFSNLLEIM